MSDFSQKLQSTQTGSASSSILTDFSEFQQSENVKNLVWVNLLKVNPELPQTHTLTQEHQEQLRRSGITPIDAAFAGIFSADADLALQLTGYYQSGLLFSYFDPTGRLYKWVDSEGVERPFFRLRPDNGTGKAKYLSPKGSPVFVYVPRVANFAWVKEGTNIKPGQNIVVTEGEKKALSATLNGIPCLGLGGVNSFKTGIKDQASDSRSLGFFIDELDVLTQQSLTICYDNDIIQKPQVAEAIKSFAYSLAEAYKEKELQAGAGVINRTQRLNNILKYSLLPLIPNEKVGLDDAIVKWGVEPVTELLLNGMPLVKIDRAKEDPKNITVKQLFCTEPLGDSASKDSPKNCQAHNRSLIAWLSLCKSYAISPLACLKYCADSGVWRSISQEELANLPQKVANFNGWQNRSTGLMRQHFDFIKERLAVDSERFTVSRLLGFTNGVLNLESLAFLPHSPENYLTQRLGFCYSETANCPEFLNWLLWTFAEPQEDGTFDSDSDLTADRIELLRALLRWSLEPKQNKAFEVEVIPYLIGMPGRGKGTLLEIVRGLAGEAAGHWNLSTIGDPNSVAAICGKLIAINSDLKGSLTPKSAETINQISSNEPVAVKLLYKDIGSQRLNTVLWAASNHSILSDTTDRQGVDRRMIYFEFKRPPESRDPKLKDRLLAELAGIFNWVWGITAEEAIETIKQYRLSSDYLQAQTNALLESNSVYQWIVDCNNPQHACPTGCFVRVDLLYQTYTQWCAAVGSNPLKQRNFARELVKGGAESKKTSHYSYWIPEADKINVIQMAGL